MKLTTETWWRHQMETFSALLAICAGNSPVPGEFPTQRPVTRSFDDFFDLRLNKRLSKQLWGWWFERLSRSLWRHRNENIKLSKVHLTGPLWGESTCQWRIDSHDKGSVMCKTFICHTWWRHQMETYSASLALCAGNSPVPVNSPHKGQWRGALMFSLIYVWINGWVNNREAGDLRRYHAHYDIIVMQAAFCDYI